MANRYSPSVVGQSITSKQDRQIGQKLMMRRWPFPSVRLLAARYRRVLTWSGGAAVILISGLLLSQSFAASFSRYQDYRDDIATLRELESTFNKEILRSRYELFASYDNLVTNIADQAMLHQQLSNIPGFVGAKDRRTLLRLLQERQTALTQKDDLSEWFKSRNALLKNSLRYLPFLTRQIEASFDVATADIATTSAPVVETDAEGSNREAVPADLESATAAPPPVAASEQSSTLDTSLNLGSAAGSAAINTLSTDQQETLRSTLNQLIRNLLLYNASGENRVADQAETLVQELATLENNLEIPQEVLPSQVFRSHANVILTTKPLVEELTGQLLLPLGQYTDELETTLEQSYQRASRRTSLFRALSLLWFVGLVTLGTRWYVKRSRHRDPAFERYQEEVGRLATTAVRLQSDNIEARGEGERGEDLLMPLVSLLERTDDLGDLARHLQGIREQQLQHQQAIREEAFAFLTAKLTLLTKNRRKLINAEVAIALRSTIEIYLAKYGCTLLEWQLEADQVSLSFRYSLSLTLSHLVHQLREETAAVIYPLAVAVESTLAGPNEIWSDAYLISSGPPPEPSLLKASMAKKGERL